MNLEQKQKAVEIFEANPQLPKLWMNPKGEFFTSEDLARNSLVKGELLESIDRVFEVENPVIEKEPTANELIAQIKAEKAIPQIEEIYLNEVDGKNRKSVIEVVEKRLEELKKLQEDGKS